MCLLPGTTEPKCPRGEWSFDTEVRWSAVTHAGQRPSFVNQLCSVNLKLPAGLSVPGIQLE